MWWQKSRHLFCKCTFLGIYLYIRALGEGRSAATSVFSAFSARVLCNSEPNFLHGFLKNGCWNGGKGLWAAFGIFSDTKKYPLNLYFGLVKNKKKVLEIQCSENLLLHKLREFSHSPVYDPQILHQSGILTFDFYHTWALFFYFFPCTSILRQNSYCCMSAMLNTVLIWSKTNEFASCTGPERGPPGLSFV